MTGRLPQNACTCLHAALSTRTLLAVFSYASRLFRSTGPRVLCLLTIFRLMKPSFLSIVIKSRDLPKETVAVTRHVLYAELPLSQLGFKIFTSPFSRRLRC